MTRKLKKKYMQVLSALALWLISKGYELEDKVIDLELELEDEAISDYRSLKR
jgi:hypothetical protein|tara:strand:- start:692 stop:847 length:156 start_codon:yes stop_codon:yes gene_type:complete